MADLHFKNTIGPSTGECVNLCCEGKSKNKDRSEIPNSWIVSNKGHQCEKTHHRGMSALQHKSSSAGSNAQPHRQQSPAEGACLAPSPLGTWTAAISNHRSLPFDANSPGHLSTSHLSSLLPNKRSSCTLASHTPCFQISGNNSAQGKSRQDRGLKLRALELEGGTGLRAELRDNKTGIEAYRLSPRATCKEEEKPGNAWLPGESCLPKDICRV